MTKMKAKAKTKKKTKFPLFYKDEAERTQGEKMCRDIVFYGLTIFTAVMWYLFISANINLVNAEADYISNQIQVVQHI